jgi:DNA-binding NarL/FixJ family response regulator
MSLRILLADANTMLRQGIRAVLEREGFQVAGEATTGYEAIQLAFAESPDVAVVDSSMPALNGLDTARQILRHGPRTGVVLLAGHTEPHLILSALRAGVRGYVLTSQAVDDLVHAIRQVAAGSIYLCPHASSVLLEAYLSGSETPTDPLTGRERQVLQLVAEGKTTKEVAALLNLSIKTAESYRTRLMAKLNVHHTAGLVRYAIRRGLIQPAAPVLLELLGYL